MAYITMGVFYAVYMALMDVFILGILKAINLGWITNINILLPTVVYAMQPWIFLTSLKYESMTVMNLLWDLISDILVTGSGLFFFKETLSRTKLLGVSLAIVSVFLMSWDDKELV
jgi:multidrug transporter EmrE-like cation transporter